MMNGRNNKQRMGWLMGAILLAWMSSVSTVSTVYAQKDPPEQTEKTEKTEKDPLAGFNKMDPKGDIEKAIKLTSKQKKSMEAIFEKRGKENDTYFDKMGDRLGEELSKKLLTQYAEPIKEIEALPEAEQSAKLESLMKKAMGEILPKMLTPYKKEMGGQFRTSMTKVFTDVDLILTKTQKPQLAIVKKKYFMRFDKEIKPLLDTIFEDITNSILQEKDTDKGDGGDN
jgi:hypothetical protein